MAEHSTIEWTESTWNPITGCTLVSEGCRNCYAAYWAATRLADHPSRKGLARLNADGVAKFTGEVRFNEQWLDQPLRWRRPRMIFVCAHGDLFHEAVPDDWIDRIFAVMALCPQHTFQVLTKRPERMRAYFVRCAMPDDAGFIAEDVRVALTTLTQTPSRRARSPALRRVPLGKYCKQIVWPLPNVWLGTSCEDQTTADQRIPHLLQTPAAIRFVSAEPLLGPIDFRQLRWTKAGWEVSLDWIIAGGESGSHARPMHPDWVRSIRDQCQAAGTAFFFKQWGEWEPRAAWSGHQGGGRFERMTAVMPDGTRCPHDVAPQDVGAHRMARVGKARAGRLLDGKEWNGMPAAPSSPLVGEDSDARSAEPTAAELGEG